MNRCNTSLSLKPRLGRYLVAAGIACTFIGTALPLAAQVQPGLGGTRTFPDAALRGTLTLNHGVNDAASLWAILSARLQEFIRANASSLAGGVA